MAENSEHKSFARRLAVSLVAALLFGSACYAFSLIFSGESRKPTLQSFSPSPFLSGNCFAVALSPNRFSGALLSGSFSVCWEIKEEWYKSAGRLSNEIFPSISCALRAQALRYHPSTKAIRSPQGLTLHPTQGRRKYISTPTTPSHPTGNPPAKPTLKATLSTG